jgi:hypothetical protein
MKSSEITLRRIFRSLGPGVTTGAADDDPSGVATYSIAGAQLGTTLLWTAWLTWPMMAAVQMLCARIGMVTGIGLAGALRAKFPRWVVGVMALALLIANTINIVAFVCRVVWCRHLHRDHPAALSPDCPCAEVAGAGAVRLRRYGIHGQARLGLRDEGVRHSLLAKFACDLGNSSGNTGDYHQSLPVFLAGRAGG